MKYKAGDKVRVKKGLKVGNCYDNVLYVNEMVEYEGKTLTIKYVADDHYKVEENIYCWNDVMFEEEKNMKSKFGGMLPNGVYIKRVLYKNPVVVTFWSDGTKTVSKCAEGDTYNPETGLLLNYLKKLQDSTQINNLLKDWLPENVKEYGDVTLRDVRKKNK